ncbi:hypothetical protein ACH5RR_014562 [Cinchona calisaya]|uniref:Uncharacterized protein n=1 Tax=Cinchona calisaya TaxID=153742 RepID=A0ABD3A362_9GENT
MDEYGEATCLEVAKLYCPALPWKLKQKSRRQQHEQHHRYHYRPPIRHAASQPAPNLDLAKILIQDFWFGGLINNNDAQDRKIYNPKKKIIIRGFVIIDEALDGIGFIV